MKKEKAVRTYQRRTKSGKMVTVHEHKASYDAAEEARKAAVKKAGAGSELASKKKAKEAGELPFTADEYKAWYHWDLENDPKNPAALKVKKALIAKLSPRGYKKYEAQMTDSWTARGHLKAFKGVGDVMKDSVDLRNSRKMAATHKAQAALADNLGAKDAAESFRKRSQEASARAKEIASRVKNKGMIEHYDQFNNKYIGKAVGHPFKFSDAGGTYDAHFVTDGRGNYGYVVRDVEDGPNGRYYVGINDTTKASEVPTAVRRAAKYADLVFKKGKWVEKDLGPVVERKDFDNLKETKRATGKSQRKEAPSSKDTPVKKSSKESKVTSKGSKITTPQEAKAAGLRQITTSYGKGTKKSMTYYTSLDGKTIYMKKDDGSVSKVSKSSMMPISRMMLEKKLKKLSKA